MRRSSLLVAVLGLAVSTAIPLSAAGASSAASPWLQPQGGASDNPVNWNERTLSPANVAEAGVVRTIDDASVTKGATCYGPGTPLITQSRIWTEFGGSLNEYSRTTGRVIQHIPLNSNVFSDIAIQGNVVVAYGTDCYDDRFPLSHVAAFNLTTGQALWTWSGYDLLSVHLVHDYAVLAARPVSDNPEVQVFDLSSGHQVWRSAEVSSFEPFDAIVADNKVIAAGMTYLDSEQQATLRAYSLTTGKILWSHYGANFSSVDPAGVFFADSPIGSSSRIYISESAPGVTYPNFFTEVYSASTGKHLYEIPSNGVAKVVGRSDVYGACSNGRAICGYRKTTGQLIWSTTYQQTDPQDICESCTSMALANGVLYLGNGQVLRASTGKQLAKLWTTDNYDPPAPSVGFGEIADSVDSGGIELYGLPAKS